MKYVALLLVAFVTACSGITDKARADAANVSYALKAGYTAALQTATLWAMQPRCGTPAAKPVPLCSTAQGVLDAEKVRVSARSGIDALDKTIADSSASQDALDAAIAAATNAVAAYRTIANTYGDK